MMQTIYRIRTYVLPIVIILGSFLNILSFFVMRRFKSTTSFYMILLAFVDTGKQVFFLEAVPFISLL